MRDYYKVLVIGQSGKGKTFMFRNMNPDTTGFINMEDKPLPFKNTFKFHKRPTSAQEVITALVEYAQNPAITTIVVDSFSAYVDLVLAEHRKTKKGFDIWNAYNDDIGRFNQLIKRIDKEIFVTGHYEMLNVEGAAEKRLKVKGKEWEGTVEKDYAVVMYAENKFDDANRPQYYLSLVGENTSAKCPPGIFGEDVIQIPNDGKFILDKIQEFVS